MSIRNLHGHTNPRTTLCTLLSAFEEVGQGRVVKVCAALGIFRNCLADEFRKDNFTS